MRVLIAWEARSVVYAMVMENVGMDLSRYFVTSAEEAEIAHIAKGLAIRIKGGTE